MAGELPPGIGYLLGRPGAERGTALVHAAELLTFSGSLTYPRLVALCGVRGRGEAAGGPVTCRRCQRCLAKLAIADTESDVHPDSPADTDAAMSAGESAVSDPSSARPPGAASPALAGEPVSAAGMSVKGGRTWPT